MEAHAGLDYAVRMKQRRTLRSIVSLLAAMAILFAQAAVAAHACADAFAGSMDHAMSHGVHDGHEDCCDDLRVVQDDLCFQHCLSEQQSVGDHPIAFAAPFSGTARYAEHHDLSRLDLKDHSRALLAHVTAPPLSVRNCCFRT
jgi:hypothetical protein